MPLMKEVEELRKKYDFNSPPGSVYRIFEINEKNGKDESGYSPVFISPEIVEKKKKKSIN
jgi:hypothetical protein